MFTFVILQHSALKTRNLRNHKAFPIVYKTVSPRQDLVVDRLSFKERTQKWLKVYLDDPFVKKMIQSSILTKAQLETLLIDILAEKNGEKALKYEEKADLRLSAVSRGSFNRTLRQARRNIIKSIYTVLLLGYLGIFEDTSLDPYLEIANKLRGYVNAYLEGSMKADAKVEHLRTMDRLREELEASLEQLSSPKALLTRT